MFNFAWPWLFIGLPLPWLLRRFVPPVQQQQGLALRVPFYAQAAAVQGGMGKQYQRAYTRLILATLAWILLVAAAARPQWVGEPIELPIAGRDLMMALDISGSMEQKDFEVQGQQVTRLQLVKLVAGDFIQRRQGDRLGLILFGSQAYLQSPLTFDRNTVERLMNDAIIRMAGPATAIGDAIGLAVKRLKDSPPDQRRLILLTDGANTAGVVEPVQAAELAAQAGLRIYTIGLGAEAMRVGGFFGSRMVNPSRDLDETSLKKIAELTGGRYFRAKDTQALESIYKELDALEPVDSDAQVFRPIQALYHWPLAAAAGLILLLGLLRLLVLYLPVWRQKTRYQSVYCGAAA